MADLGVGGAWEVYSQKEGRWIRAVVTKIEDDEATLRYEGLLEFLTVPVADLEQKDDLYRRAERVPPPSE